MRIYRSNLFVPYKHALELKELGFDEECVAFWDPRETEDIRRPWLGNRAFNSNDDRHGIVFAAPLWQQAFDWINQKYDLYSYIERFDDGSYDYCITSDKFPAEEVEDEYEDDIYDSRVRCLKRLFEYISELK